MNNQDAPTRTHTVTSNERFLRLPAVCDMSGLSRSQIYRLQAVGLFPQGVKLGQSAIAWLESEVVQWQADRAASRQQRASCAGQAMQRSTKDS